MKIHSICLTPEGRLVVEKSKILSQEFVVLRMTTQRTPSKNQQSDSGDKDKTGEGNVTLTMVFQELVGMKNYFSQEMTEMKNAFAGEMAEIKKTQAHVMDKLTNIEKEQFEIAVEQDNMRSDVVRLQDDVQNLDERINEGIRRATKLSNIMIWGIPEDDMALQKVKDLIKIILPESFQHVRVSEQNRVGTANNGKPRGFCIRLANPGERREALGNCKLLKGRQEFVGISIARDKTKAEIEAEKQRPSPVSTRSRKRKTNERDHRDPKVRRKENMEVDEEEA